MRARGRRNRAKRAARELADRRWFQLAARTGLATSAGLNLVLAAIAITIAAGVRRGSGDGGALEQLSRMTGGVVLLWVAAAALVALGLWESVLAVAVRERSAPKKWGARVRHAAQAIAYAGLGVIALRFAIGGPDDGNEATRLGSLLLSSTGGAVVVALIGVAITAVGAAFVVVGVRGAFVDHQLDAPPRLRRVALITGVVGYVGRGAVLAVIGGLWVASAFSDDPALATGVDGAFAELARNPLGLALLMAIAVGFASYALYTAIRAKHPRVAP